KDTLHGIWQGIISLKKVENAPLFLIMSLAIWVCYFLHHYLAFFCFEATSNLGFSCGLVTFIVGSFAVIVPTPNGAGPWHFAVKTMLILYGVADNDALFFVLIVHSVQTLLVVLLGIYAWITLLFTEKRETETSNEFNNNNPNNHKPMV
ncbi:MAG: flippase-like domain-containing protein, partial [Prevotella sp.]|nr:flippase-like domain-containing protein [Prevotella sp.]